MMDSGSINPYPGLRSFNTDETEFFFGREGQSEALVNRLRNNRFLAVIGTSGSGKSSLVRAGLLPSLWGGYLANAGSPWRIAITNPGNAPIYNLAKAINYIIEAEKDPETEPDQLRLMMIDTLLNHNSLGLAETINQFQISKNENWLIVIDQFEELFRLKYRDSGAETDKKVAHFVELLLQAFKQSDVPIYVCITMRSDFLGDCSQFRDLPEAINDGQYLIPRMDRAERRQAISSPAFVGNPSTEMTPRLTNRILNDVGDNPDQLPILQHALMQTWHNWYVEGAKGQIDLPHYDAVGGMDQALSNHAESAYQSLKPAQRQIAKKMFKCLAEKGEDNREIRRPTLLKDLSAICKAPESKIIEVIEVFREPGRTFLMPPVAKKLDSRSLIDVSHESLIRQWDRLETWVQEESRSAFLYKRLAETAVLYERDEAGLWGEPDLQIALRWQKEADPNKDWAVRYHPGFESAMRFLQESDQNHRDQLLAEEQKRKLELKQAQDLARAEKERAEIQAKSASRFRKLTAWLVLLSLLAIAFAVYGFYQQRQAQRSANQAKTAQEIAEANANLATESAKEAEIQRASAEASEKEAQENYRLAEAARADVEVLNIDLRATANKLRQRQTELEAQTDSTEDALEKVRNQLQLTTTLKLAAKAEQFLERGADTLGALLARQAYFFDNATQNEFKTEVFRALSKAHHALAPDSAKNIVMRGKDSDGTEDWIRSVAISPAGNQLVFGGADGTIWLNDLESPSNESIRLGSHQTSVRSITFDSSGKYFATASNDKSIFIWQTNALSAQAPVKIEPQNAVKKLLFVPNRSDIIVWLDQAGHLSLCHWSEKNIYNSKANEGTSLISMVFHPQEHSLFATDKDGTIQSYKFDASHDRPDLEFANNLASGPPRSLETMAISPNGNLLATGGYSHDVIFWEITSTGSNDNSSLLNFKLTERAKTSRHKGPVNELDFSSDGKLLASASSDQTVRLWDVSGSSNKLNLAALQLPIILAEHDKWVWSVQFSRNSNILISGSGDRTVRIWETDMEKLTVEICQFLDGLELSQEDWNKFVGSDLDYNKLYQPCIR